MATLFLKTKIQYIILAATIFFLIKSAYDWIWYTLDDRIASNVIQSIVCAIIFLWIKEMHTKKVYKRLSKVDSYLGRKVISCGMMNHVRGIIADGGIGYLLSDCLVFVPHKLNLSRVPLTIMLSDIEHVSSYRVLGMFDTRLKIALKSGKVEQFVIDNKDLLCKLSEVNKSGSII